MPEGHPGQTQLVLVLMVCIILVHIVLDGVTPCATSWDHMYIDNCMCQTSGHSTVHGPPPVS